jgi:hypothetical protein
VRSTHSFIRKLLGGVAAAGIGLSSAPAQAADEVKVLVLKEHGVGGKTTAQAYVDSLVSALAARNKWPAATGMYLTSLKTAEAWITANQPSFGIMTLPGFLKLRASKNLAVVGQAIVKSAGGRQYFLISKTQTSLAGCKGKTLVSDHADDPRFIEKVVGGGEFTLAEFQFEATRRPVQTLKKITRGEAECALVDDAQMNSLGSLDGADGVKAVWKSDKLPPMVIVSFGGVSADMRNKFRTVLPQVCVGTGKAACDEAGLGALRVASEVQYQKLIKAYG